MPPQTSSVPEVHTEMATALRGGKLSLGVAKRGLAVAADQIGSSRPAPPPPASAGRKAKAEGDVSLQLRVKRYLG